MWTTSRGQYRAVATDASTRRHREDPPNGARFRVRAANHGRATRWTSSPSRRERRLRHSPRTAERRSARSPRRPAGDRSASSQITRRISAVAVCCSSASFVSLNRRTFSMAMTAWSAKVLSSAICLSVNGPASGRADDDRPDRLRRRGASAPPAGFGSRLRGALEDSRSPGPERRRRSWTTEPLRIARPEMRVRVGRIGYTCRTSSSHASEKLWCAT